jgi:hypothetical protein
VTEALTQARLLFKLSTCLADWPDDPDEASLARYAVLSLADQLTLDQKHAVTVASPFQSESIGSYSYSKTSVRTKVLQGLPTGVSWFDLAVERLGVCEVGAHVESGSIQVFSDDLQLLEDPDGRVHVLGPRDVQPIDTPFDVSTQTVHDPQV